MVWFFRWLHFLAMGVLKESLKLLTGFFGKMAKTRWVPMVSCLRTRAHSSRRKWYSGFVLLLPIVYVLKAYKSGGVSMTGPISNWFYRWESEDDVCDRLGHVCNYSCASEAFMFRQLHFDGFPSCWPEHANWDFNKTRIFMTWKNTKKFY